MIGAVALAENGSAQNIAPTVAERCRSTARRPGVPMAAID